MRFVFLFDARNRNEYVLRIGEEGEDKGKIKPRLFAFEPGKNESQPLPPNASFYAFEEQAFVGQNEKGAFMMRAHVWHLEADDKGRLAGVPSDSIVDYNIYIIENGSRYEVSYQLSLDNLPPLTKAIVSRPGFPANFTHELDTSKFSPERLKEGTMDHEEISALTLPPHHGPRAGHARNNLPNAIMNQPEEPKVMPLRLVSAFNMKMAEDMPRTGEASPIPRKRKPPSPHKP